MGCEAPGAPQTPESFKHSIGLEMGLSGFQIRPVDGPEIADFGGSKRLETASWGSGGQDPWFGGPLAGTLHLGF